MYQDNGPLFSVIVPVYKVEKYLNQCVDSILAQTFRNFELILVDDGSPDDCGAICDEYARKDSRVKVIHKGNGGIVSARQAGYRISKGKYICNVDSDDYIAPELLAMAEEKIRASCGVFMEQKIRAAMIVNIHQSRCSVETFRIDNFCIGRNSNFVSTAKFYNSIPIKGNRTIPNNAIFQNKFGIDNCVHIFPPYDL